VIRRAELDHRSGGAFRAKILDANGSLLRTKHDRADIYVSLLRRRFADDGRAVKAMTGESASAARSERRHRDGRAASNDGRADHEDRSIRQLRPDMMLLSGAPTAHHHHVVELAQSLKPPTQAASELPISCRHLRRQQQGHEQIKAFSETAPLIITENSASLEKRI